MQETNTTLNTTADEISFYKIVVDGYLKARNYKEAMHFVLKIKNIDSSFDVWAKRRLASGVLENLKPCDFMKCPNCIQVESIKERGKTSFMYNPKLNDFSYELEKKKVK